MVDLSDFLYSKNKYSAWLERKKLHMTRGQSRLFLHKTNETTEDEVIICGLQAIPRNAAIAISLKWKRNLKS